MAQTYSITEDVSYHTPYGQAATPIASPSHTLRNSLIAAGAALVFAGAAIVYGVGRLPPVEAFAPATTPMTFVISDQARRTPLQPLPPEIAAPAHTQPVHVEATVMAPDIPAAVHDQPMSTDMAVDDAQPVEPRTATPADAVAAPSDAVADEPLDGGTAQFVDNQ